MTPDRAAAGTFTRRRGRADGRCSPNALRPRFRGDLIHPRGHPHPSHPTLDNGTLQTRTSLPLVTLPKPAEDRGGGRPVGGGQAKGGHAGAVPGPSSPSARSKRRAASGGRGAARAGRRLAGGLARRRSLGNIDSSLGTCRGAAGATAQPLPSPQITSRQRAPPPQAPSRASCRHAAPPSPGPRHRLPTRTKPACPSPPQGRAPGARPARRWHREPVWVATVMLLPRPTGRFPVPHTE